MADSSLIEALHDLVARGLMAAEPAPQRLAGGNRDRQAQATRSAWRVTLPSGASAKLTLGSDLGLIATRQTALAAACPSIAAAPLFFAQLPHAEALAESYFAGETLEQAANAAQLPAATLSGALAQVSQALTSTEQPSSEVARAAEWQTWSQQVVALAAWQPTEKVALTELILPALYQRLTQTPPTTRWSNGDFLPSNILVQASGAVRLIDAEHATRTHFYREDAVRFNLLSPAARSQPALFRAHMPDPGPAWHLYFWLRQLQLEAEHNAADYVQRLWPVRLAVIRRWAEQTLGISVAGWSVEATAVHYKIETAHWAQNAQSDLQLSGWCHVPAATALRAIVCTSGDQRLAETVLTARPDVAVHFPAATGAERAGFFLSITLPDPDAPLALAALTDDGTLLPFHALRAGDLPGRGPALGDYEAWAAQHDPDPPAPTIPPAPGPQFSILLPVYRTPLPFLRECLASVQSQHYPHWELIIVDDASESAEITTILQQAATDARVRLQPREKNGGIAVATNAALAAARGEFMVLLDHDDVLRPHALAEFAQALIANPQWDALYSDEDKITADGRRVLPFLKPDFSPEFLLGVMYIGHVLAVRTTLARRAGGFDAAYDGIQDYEFFLRLSEQTRQIGHVARILYHWRQSPGSSALHGNVKGDMDEKQRQAVQAHLRRVGRSEHVAPAGGHRARLQATVIPTVEIIQATDEENPVTILRRAATKSTAEVLMLIAPEVTANQHALQALAASAVRPDAGVIGPVLLSREGAVLEAGWAVSPRGSAPLMRGFDPTGDGYHGTLRCAREVTTVSPLCVAVSRTLLLEPVLAETSNLSWLNFCQSLIATGRFNRVVATAQVPTTLSWRDEPRPMGTTTAPITEQFFNPHFDVRRADYTLRNQGESAPPCWHLDTPPPTAVSDGCVYWRGWCFSPARGPLMVRVTIPEHFTWPAANGLARPDVYAQHPTIGSAAVGFELRLRLPTGKYEFNFEAVAADGTVWPLFQQTTRVSAWQRARYFLLGSLEKLLPFQLIAAPSQRPRPLPVVKIPSCGARPSPRLAIVTPSFQQAKFLEQTMRSVLEQSGIECAYVVQDGGSADGSRAIIERLAAETGDVPLLVATSPACPVDSGWNHGVRPPAGAGANVLGSGASSVAKPRQKSSEQGSQTTQPSTFNLQLSTSGAPRLVAWASASDAGQADAIKRGFAKTSGGPDDVMAWINSDDFYLPGALAYVVDYFARHPDVEVIYGHRMVVDENSQKIGRWFLPQHDSEVLRLNDFVPQETMFWRRRIWDRVGGIDASFKFAMDWDLLLRFQAAGARMVRVPYFLACFRVHAAQKTSAQIQSIGQAEINHLRERAQGRVIAPEELGKNSRLLRYLRRSALIELMWKFGIRMP